MAPPSTRTAHRRTAPTTSTAETTPAPSPAQAAADRAAAARWAASLYADPNVVVLDTETTSKEARGRVVEVAVLDTAGHELLHTRVNPGVPIAPEAAAVHGITPAQLADAPRFSEIADALTLAVAGRRVVCWNAPFDRRILAGEYARLLGTDEAGKIWAARAQWECAMRRHAAWAGRWCGERAAWKWHRLTEVAAGDHTAAGDCRAALRALAAMAQTAEAPEPAPAPRAHTPTHSVRVRLDGPRADVEALTRALAEGRAQVEHLDTPAPGRRGGYLAYGRLTTRPEAPRA